MKRNHRLSVGLVFDDSLDSTDGVAQYVKTVGSWLAAQGHDVSYLVGQSELKQWAGGSVYSLSRNIRVIFNGNRLSIPLPANKRRIKALLRSKNFDVIHVMMPHSPFMAQRVINLVDGRAAVIGTFHVYPAGKLARWGGRILRTWYGRKIQRVDQIISVSSAAAEYASEVFKFDTEVIPNPIELSRFQATKEFEQANRVVFLGRLAPRKGCIQLIRAFSKMKDNSASLIVAGKGSQRQRLQAEAKNLGVAERIEFIGFVPEAKKADLLASARVACFPSLYGESFGIVLVEAMAAGSGLVLGGDNPGYRSVLKDQPHLLVDPNDTIGFASRLDLFLDDSPVNRELHQWQSRTVKQYDINKVGPRIVERYNQQIARRTKKGNN